MNGGKGNKSKVTGSLNKLKGITNVPGIPITASEAFISMDCNFNTAGLRYGSGIVMGIGRLRNPLEEAPIKLTNRLPNSEFKSFRFYVQDFTKETISEFTVKSSIKAHIKLTNLEIVYTRGAVEPMEDIDAVFHMNMESICLTCRFFRNSPVHFFNENAARQLAGAIISSQVPKIEKKRAIVAQAGLLRAEDSTDGALKKSRGDISRAESNATQGKSSELSDSGDGIDDDDDNAALPGAAFD